MGLIYKSPSGHLAHSTISGHLTKRCVRVCGGCLTPAPSTVQCTISGITTCTCASCLGGAADEANSASFPMGAINGVHTLTATGQNSCEWRSDPISITGDYWRWADCVSERPQGSVGFTIIYHRHATSSDLEIRSYVSDLFCIPLPSASLYAFGGSNPSMPACNSPDTINADSSVCGETSGISVVVGTGGSATIVL